MQGFTYTKKNIWNSADDKQHGKPIALLHSTIEHVFKRAYFVHPFEGKQHPNIGSIYERLQLTKKYSRNERRFQKDKIIASAHQAFAAKALVESVPFFITVFITSTIKITC
ncbi:hypothetical protein DET54_10520 [Paenibacillus pabuli]|uniref:Uncharacterized protein n=1 Tax=Paenibacillus pabuli TaxID=1472 RepID=A0ABX9BKM0_9BACL|nr:hypothetical protein DET54_10520 [Paenibacillus pabuli]